MQLLPIFKEAIPYEAEYKLEQFTFKLRFDYNMIGDFFTVSLFKRGEPLILGEKIVFGKALFSSYPADDRLPFPVIIPIDLSLNQTRAGWRETMDSVFLYMPTPEDAEVMENEMA